MSKQGSDLCKIPGQATPLFQHSLTENPISLLSFWSPSSLLTLSTLYLQQLQKCLRIVATFTTPIFDAGQGMEREKQQDKCECSENQGEVGFSTELQLVLIQKATTALNVGKHAVFLTDRAHTVAALLIEQ